jgi:hypothetical protein
METVQLSKKDQIRMRHEAKGGEQEGQKKKRLMVKWMIIGGVILLASVGSWWSIRELSKPLPGGQFPSQGRDHVTEDVWSKFQYNSNPPTSGPHDPVWTASGIYNVPVGDGHLVHSLEHGYVEISYNCDVSGGTVEYNATASAQLSSPSAVTSDLWKRKDCQELAQKLSDLANEKRLWKLIVVPRPTLDTKIALTAWTWLDKFNDFDRVRIIRFIDAHRDHGPEQTME